jgi:hypothetical protein
VEHRLSHWKHHELPSFCPQDFGQLSCQARRALCRMRRGPTRVSAFWERAELFPLSHRGNETSHAVIPTARWS